MSKFHSRLKTNSPLNMGNRGIFSTIYSTEVRHRHPRTEFWRISENLHAYQKILKKMPAYSEWQFFMFFTKFIHPIIFYIHRTLYPILPKIEKWGFLHWKHPYTFLYLEPIKIAQSIYYCHT